MFEEYFDKQIDKFTMFQLAAKVREKVAEMISLYREGVTWDHPYGKKIKKGYNKNNQK